MSETECCAQKLQRDKAMSVARKGFEFNRAKHALCLRKTIFIPLLCLLFASLISEIKDHFHPRISDAIGFY